MRYGGAFSLILLSALIFSKAFAACNSNIENTKPNQIYVDSGNTVTDSQTGLMWMKCSLGQSGNSCAAGAPSSMDWAQALSAAKSANSGAGTFGFTDWRLPNHNELISLVEKSCYNPSINTVLFPSTQNAGYWTSSLASNVMSYARFIGFHYGYDYSGGKDTVNFVRLVRDAY